MPRTWSAWITKPWVLTAFQVVGTFAATRTASAVIMSMPIRRVIRGLIGIWCFATIFASIVTRPSGALDMNWRCCAVA